MEGISIIDTTLDNIAQYGVCGYKNPKREGFPEKLEWLKSRFPQGLKIKTLYSEKDGPQGMIEFIPGEYCWRPVNARGYMFIHCIFVGFKKIYKNQGHASRLLKACEQETKALNLAGIAVVTRKGSFMAGRDFFIKHGFETVDSAKPDFELLVKKFIRDAPDPEFKKDMDRHLDRYARGLTIIRAGQCPYTVKNVREISDAAQKDFRINANIVNLATHEQAQNSPCPFGAFCIVYDGKIIAEHPISKTRFINIMKKIRPASQ